MEKEEITIFVAKNLQEIGGVQIINKKIVAGINNEDVLLRAQLFSFRENNGGKININGLYCDIIKFIKIAKNNSTRNFVFSLTGIEILLFSSIAKLFGKNIIYWEHGHPEYFKKIRSAVIVKKFFYKSAKSVVVLHRQFVDVNRVLNYKIIPNPIPKPAKIHSFHQKPASIKRVAWVGRLSPEKQPDLALSAIINASKKSPDVQFIFVHAPYMKFNHENSIKNLVLKDGATYKFTEELNENTLFLLTSTMEAMPGVIFEALACGAKLIATNCTPWLSDLKCYHDLTTFAVSINENDLDQLINQAIRDGNKGSDVDKIAVIFERLSEKTIIREWINVLS